MGPKRRRPSLPTDFEACVSWWLDKSTKEDLNDDNSFGVRTAKSGTRARSVRAWQKLCDDLSQAAEDDAKRISFMEMVKAKWMVTIANVCLALIACVE
jgi:hypothetical protein